MTEITVGDVWKVGFRHPEDEELGDSTIANCDILTPVGATCFEAIQNVKMVLDTLDPHPCVRRHFLMGLQAHLGILYHG